ncbi:MAG: divalent-cation tolerance protein CutA [Spirochaetota bacterium]|nr:divalent-cation tolerance protein CutA [Spirochaetota bacterium]
MRVVFCTCPVSEAEKITKTLLIEQLVACVNIIPNIQSHYIWKGEICHDEESLLVIKTKKELISLLTKRINEIHPYDTVEIIAFEIKEGDSKYLSWINAVTKSI